jgi:hypothetical protein
MTAANEPEATRSLRRQKPKPPPLPRHREPGAEPPPSASSTIPIRPEDIISELDK